MFHGENRNNSLNEREMIVSIIEYEQSVYVRYNNAMYSKADPID